VAYSQNYTYDTYYFRQPIDHFSFYNQDHFQERYLVNNDSWEGNGGPIFFYTGNEGDIVMFLENTGFMFDVAPEFKALLVFAEHRYYGLTQPYGNTSYDLDKIGYLTSEQALADFADLIVYLKATVPGAADSPVIAFGGSYGGMLAAWARIKYPHIYAGALASSAPIWQFTGLTPCPVFYQIVTKAFTDVSPQCSDTIRKSWEPLNTKFETEAGKQWITETFNLCTPITDDSSYAVFKYWLMNAWTNLAMINYPYAANFIEPLPAWPVQGACEFLTGTYDTDDEILTAIASAAFFYSNYTGQIPCIDTQQDASPSLGDLGWAYQSCNEMVMPMCSDGVNDMFEPTSWNLTVYTIGCQELWHVTPRPFMVPIEYGGKDLSASSNIVFSNGELDPWSGGGVLESISDTLIALVIEESAHHLDLRSSNPADPASVINAREIEKSYIETWIYEANIQTFKKKYQNKLKFKHGKKHRKQHMAHNVNSVHSVIRKLSKY